MNIFISPYLPSNYKRKKHILGWCGVYSIEAIIDAYQLATADSVADYTKNYIEKITWHILPWWLTRLLRKQWLRTSLHRSKHIPREEKIDRLQKALQIWPIILTIGHAYTGKSKFVLWRAILMQHYIVVWGYDKRLRQFFVYDSGASRKLIRTDLPAGNITIAYDDLIRYRNRGGRGMIGNAYVQIHGIQAKK